MKNQITNIRSLLLLIVPVLLINGCSSLPQFESKPCTTKIIINGDNNDWNGIPAYINKNNTFAVSVCNDTEFLYVCLTSYDPQTQMKIMGNGLTIWFDRKGSDNKTFGINFPLGRQIQGISPIMNRERMRDPQEISKIMEQALFELEIVGKEESGRYRLAVTNNEGIKVKIGRSKENLMIMVYELQVPLRKTTQYQHAIEVAEDPYVGLGVEIGYMMKPSERKPGEKLEGRDRNGPPPGAGMENDGGGPPGGGRRPQGRPMARGEKTEPEEMWWRVRLTSPDQP